MPLHNPDTLARSFLIIFIHFRSPYHVTMVYRYLGTTACDVFECVLQQLEKRPLHR